MRNMYSMLGWLYLAIPPVLALVVTWQAWSIFDTRATLREARQEIEHSKALMDEADKTVNKAYETLETMRAKCLNVAPDPKL